MLLKTEIIHIIRSDEDPGRFSKRPLHDKVINRRQGHCGALRKGKGRCQHQQLVGPGHQRYCLSDNKGLCKLNKPFKYNVTGVFMQNIGAGLHTCCNFFTN